MPLTESEIIELQDGLFLLHAMEITLTRKGDSSDVYRGPGFIRQSPDRMVEYTIYEQERLPGLSSFSTTPMGAAIPDDQFYDLRMLDWRGRAWEGQRTLPNSVGVFGRRGVICRGKLDEITCTAPTQREDGLYFYFPGKYRIPSNAVTKTIRNNLMGESQLVESNLWRICSERYEIVVLRLDTGIEITVTSNTEAVPDCFERRLEETIWFTLAAPVHWTLREERKVGTARFFLRSIQTQCASPRVRPPLDLPCSETTDQVSELFARYLRYVLQFTELRYHPTSVNVLRILRASAISMDAEAQATTIAIESLVRREFDSLGLPKPEFVCAIESAIQHINEWSGEDSVKRRITTAVQGWRRSNPREALNKLVEQGVITTSQLKAWNSLRHPSAHGQELGSPLEELRLCNHAYMAWLRLLLKLLDYKGPYIDRAVNGWPTVWFP